MESENKSRFLFSLSSHRPFSQLPSPNLLALDMSNLLAITKTNFFKPLLTGFIFLSYILCSYPLHVLYLCFFTPYILKLLSFLYPLFITTSLVLISLVTAISPGLVKETFLGTESSLLSAYDAVSKMLQCRIDDEGEGEDFRSLEALQMYKIVFDTSMLDELGSHVCVSEEYPEEKILRTVDSSVLKILQKEEQDSSVKTEEASKGDTILEQDSSIDDSQLESIKSVIKKFEGFLKNTEEADIRDRSEEIKTVQTEMNQTFEEQITEPYIKVVKYGNSMLKSKNSQSRRQSSRTNTNHTENNSELSSKDEMFRQPRNDLGKYGSLRKEREWRSTLACKLFEEKHNSSSIEGIEGMDLLWEKYDEGESVNGQTKKETKKIDSSKSKNVKYVYGEDEEEDDDDDLGVHLCCLQAFKLSATKMSMGVGRRNLAKISKAVKGLGWMHKASKHSKKVHNNGETVQFA